MKKIKLVICFTFIIIASLFFTSCDNENNYHKSYSINDSSYFIVVEKIQDCYEIVYDKKTKVMYIISRGLYNSGNATILVDSDGKPLLWKGE